MTFRVGDQINSQVDDCMWMTSHQGSVSSPLFLTARSATLKGLLRCKIGAISSLWVWFQFFLFTDSLCTYSSCIPLFSSNLSECPVHHTDLGKPLNHHASTLLLLHPQDALKLLILLDSIDNWILIYIWYTWYLLPSAWKCAPEIWGWSCFIVFTCPDL